MSDYCYICLCPMGARGCPHTLDEPPIVLAIPDAVRLQVLEEFAAEATRLRLALALHPLFVDTINDLREKAGRS